LVPAKRRTGSPALLAVVRDLLPEASTLTAIADECQWNQELPEEEAELACRIEAWVVQVQLLARSIFRTLGEEAAATAWAHQPGVRRSGGGGLVAAATALFWVALCGSLVLLAIYLLLPTPPRS
jgi:hypothetical protein